MDKAVLFKPRLPEEPLEIEGVGTIRIRGLSRIESFLVGTVEGKVAQERKILRYGVVDPKISEADAERWQKASPGGELENVTRRISELSGMGPDSSKSGVPGDGGEPGDRVRALPGDQAGDDGGPAPAGDE